MNLILRLLPYLMPIAESVVTMIERRKAGASGPEKKAAAMEVFQASIPLLEHAVKEPVPWQDIAQVADVAIEVGVKSLNALGVLQHEGLTDAEKSA